MKLELFCLKWGTWSSPCSEPFSTCLTGLDAVFDPFLALDIEACDHFLEPNNTVLDLFYHGECFIAVPLSS